MTNPYNILNIDKDLPLEAVKARYLELKAKYSEDRFLPGNAGNEACHKLTELETAFKEIEAARISNDVAAATACFVKINQLINSGNYTAAQAELDAFTSHSAEWHYMQAMLFYRREWTSDAKAQLEMALAIEPHNPKYNQALERLKFVIGNPKTPQQSLGNNLTPNESGIGNVGRTCGPCATCCAANLCLNCLCGGGMCGR